MKVYYKIIVLINRPTDFLDRTFQSIDRLRSSRYEVCVVDNNTEQTEPAKSWCERHGWAYVRNPDPSDKASGFLLGMDQFDCEDDDVVFSMEGGDWLLSDWTLDALYKIHVEEGYPVSYCRSIRYREGTTKDASRYSKRVVSKGSFRKARWVYGPMRSFKYGIWKQIPREEILSSKSLGWERATFFPVLERAGSKIRFNKQYLYVTS